MTSVRAALPPEMYQEAGTKKKRGALQRLGERAL